jgi:uncharacterized membrane protein AbrB (regulator of aidB expression)
MNKLRKHFHLLPITIIVLSAIAKLGGLTQSAENLPLPQMADKLIPILLIELSCIILFAIPKFRLIAFFLICSYLGGAIAVNYILGLATPIIPILVLILFWIAMYLQKVDLFKI